MKKLIKASLRFEEKEKEYCKLENNKKLYLVTTTTSIESLQTIHGGHSRKIIL